MAEPAQDHLYFLLTLGTSGVLILALFIVIYFFIYQKRIFVLQEQKQKMEIEFQERMSHAQLEAQEKDRTRIAAELHDSLGSLLWGAKLNAAYIERSISMTPEAIVSHAELMSILDSSLETVRRIAWQLTPEVFQHDGLTKSLERLCKSVDGKGIKVNFETHDETNWNDNSALQVFRMVQELVSNSIKHAQATTIHVSLHCPGDTRFIVVEDDGIGLQQESEHGVGWWSIRQRARQLGAEIIIGQPPSGKGLSVTISIPLAS